MALYELEFGFNYMWWLCKWRLPTPYRVHSSRLISIKGSNVYIKSHIALIKTHEWLCIVFSSLYSIGYSQVLTCSNKSQHQKQASSFSGRIESRLRPKVTSSYVCERLTAKNSVGVWERCQGAELWYNYSCYTVSSSWADR